MVMIMTMTSKIILYLVAIAAFLTHLTLACIMLKMAKLTFKILWCEHRRTFKVLLNHFKYNVSTT